MGGRSPKIHVYNINCSQVMSPMRSYHTVVGSMLDKMSDHVKAAADYTLNCSFLTL